MNLSQRLDQARAMRERGEVKDGGPTPYDLRMTKDEGTYDGRNLRTGQEMTEEGWEALAESHGAGLPTWNPKRANAEVTIDLTVDIEEAPSAEVIDIRERAAVNEDDVFEMPAWARGETVFRSERE
jgi:hypothetical protein